MTIGTEWDFDPDYTPTDFDCFMSKPPGCITILLMLMVAPVACIAYLRTNNQYNALLAVFCMVVISIISHLREYDVYKEKRDAERRADDERIAI